jgi:Leucine-rich repeat (LRR) protein
MSSGGGDAVGARAGAEIWERSVLEAKYREDPNVRGLCEHNGVSLEEFLGESQEKDHMDMFMSACTSTTGCRYFTGLRSLLILQQPNVTEIQGLEYCRGLQSIWIQETSVSSLRGVETCVNLQQLHVNSNKITSLEGLGRLQKLEVLWANDNQIKTIDGVSSLTNLKVLWLARNQIEVFSTCLDLNVNLSELNLADNKVGCFKELLNLARLPALRKLSLSDPHFGENPVCGLCNYQTYVMYQLHQITSLDTMEIGQESKQMAEATYMKKNMYYNMRIKTMKRNTTNIVRKAQEAAQRQIDNIIRDVTSLACHQKDVQRAQYEIYGQRELKADGIREQGEEGASEDEEAEGPSFEERVGWNLLSDEEDAKSLDGRFKSKNEYLARTIKQKTVEAELVKKRQRELKTQVCEVSEQNICRLLLELETGGNIRLEDGKPSDVWHSSCVDLVNSRFFPPDFQVHGINGIQVHRVTRIHNRFLRNRFETRMDSLQTKQAEAQSTKQAEAPTDGQNKLEYLFYVQPPVLGVGARQHSEALRIAEEGFQSVDHYRKLGQHKGAIRLSNSVSMTDLPRVGADFYLHGRKGGPPDRSDPNESEPPASEFVPFEDFGLGNGDESLPEPVRKAMREGKVAMERGDYSPTSGVLLIVKVFLGTCGKASEEDGGEVTGEWPEKYPGKTSVVRSKQGDSKQKEWFVFENALILPEYLVEFEYDTSSTRSAPVVTDTAATLRGELSGVSGSGTQLSEQEIADLSPLVLPLLKFMHLSSLTFEKPGEAKVSEEAAQMELTDASMKRIESALAMEPQLKTRKKVELASSGNLLSLSHCQSLTAIRHLNLHGSGLQRVHPCFSECKNLTTLVLSNNGLQKVDSLSGLASLQYLDLSFNKLKALDGFRGLSSLLTLVVNNNLIQSYDDVAAVKTYLRSLESLDLRDNPISGSKSYRLTTLVHLRSLNCLRELDQQEVTAEDRAAAASGEVNSRITPSIIRAHARGGGLMMISELANGRNSMVRAKAKEEGAASAASAASEASEAGRMADDGEGRPEVTGEEGENGDAEWLSEVEQLELNHHGLRRLSGLSKLGNLRRASFADNELSRIEGLDDCPLLEELNLEENQISTITGLESALYLKKLDLGKNRLTKLENVSHMVHLTQLSLEDNAIESLDGLQALVNLMELYIGNNNVSVLKEVKHLKEMPKMIILDLSGNPLCAHEFYRLYSVYYLQKLKVLDGAGVDVNERSLARERYSGKLTFDFLTEKLGHSEFEQVRELELASCRLREIVDLSGQEFHLLRELNLDNNFLQSVSGLSSLPNLLVLRLNHNRIETLYPPLRQNEPPPSPNSSEVGLCSCQKLEVLQLGYNCISDMSALGLHFLPELKVLFLQGNEISRVSGLSTCFELRELVLDKNRVKELEAHSLVALTRLRELRIEENGLKSLAHFTNLVKLQSLYLGFNRIADIAELDKLGSIPFPLEMTLGNNPVARKQLYRPSLIHRFPTLKFVDGKEISIEERERVELLFMQDRSTLVFHQDPRTVNYQGGMQGMMHMQQQAAKVPVKLTSVNFDSLAGANRRTSGMQGGGRNQQHPAYAMGQDGGNQVQGNKGGIRAHAGAALANYGRELADTWNQQHGASGKREQGGASRSNGHKPYMPSQPQQPQHQGVGRRGSGHGSGWKPRR